MEKGDYYRCPLEARVAALEAAREPEKGDSDTIEFRGMGVSMRAVVAHTCQDGTKCYRLEFDQGVLFPGLSEDVSAVHELANWLLETF